MIGSSHRHRNRPNGPKYVRVTISTPDGEVVSSVWGEVQADRVTLSAVADGVAAGWRVAWRGFAGTITEVAAGVIRVSATEDET